MKYERLRIFLLSAGWNCLPTTTIRIVRPKCVIICKHRGVVSGNGTTSLRYLPLWYVQVNDAVVSDSLLLLYFYYYYYYYRVEIINNQREYITEFYTSPKASPYGRAIAAASGASRATTSVPGRKI